MKSTLLITGAGSGLGEGAALGIARAAVATEHFHGPRRDSPIAGGTKVKRRQSCGSSCGDSPAACSGAM